jgi:hypothetical protein
MSNYKEQLATPLETLDKSIDEMNNNYTKAREFINFFNLTFKNYLRVKLINFFYFQIVLLIETQTVASTKLNDEHERVVAQNKQLEMDLRSIKLERDHFKELHCRQNPGNRKILIDKTNNTNNNAKARKFNFSL